MGHDQMEGCRTCLDNRTADTNTGMLKKITQTFQPPMVGGTVEGIGTLHRNQLFINSQGCLIIEEATYNHMFNYKVRLQCQLSNGP